MAGKSAAVKVAILADNSSLIRGLNQSESKLSSFGKKVGKMAAAAGAAAAVGLGLLAKASVDAASQAQQSLGATETVFGRFAKDVIKTSNAAATALGLSANAYRENANILGSLLANQGVAADQLAGKTKGLIKTGADLAATFGGTTTEAVEALASAFKGEFDPLERYGVSIKQSAINTEAMAVAGVTTTAAFNELTDAQKAAAKQTATTNLLTKQTAKTQGAFAKETNTLAHQQQVLGAQWENLKAKLGSVLLPVLTKAFAFINTEAIPAITEFGEAARQKLAPAFEAIGDAGAALVDKLSPVTNWLRKNPAVVKGAAIALGVLAVAIGGVSAAMLVLSVVSSPITVTILAIAALGGAIAYAYKQSATFRAGVAAVGDTLQRFGAAVLELAKKVATNLRPVFDQLVTTFRAKVVPALAQVAAKLREWWPTISKVIGFVLKLEAKWIEFQALILGKVLPVLIKFGAFMTGVLVKNIAAVIAISTAFAKKFAEVGRAAIAAGIKIGQFAAAVVRKIGQALTYIGQLPGRVKSATSGAITWLVQVGRDMIQGLINGITSMAGNLIGAIKSSVTDKIPGFIKDAWDSHSPSRLFKAIGIDAVKGLMLGFEKGSEGIGQSLAKITDAITKTLDKGLAARQKAIRKRLSGKAETAALKASEKAWKAHATAVRKALADEIAALRENGKKQDAVTRKLENAKAALKDLRDARRDYIDSIKSGAVDFASVTNLDVAFNPKAMIAEMKHRLEKIRWFNSILQDLVAKGLDPTIVNQLAEAGVEGGLARALAIQQGGQAAIDEFTQLQQAINTAATQLGTTAGNDMYDAGIAAAEGLVKGLQAQETKLENAARRLARNLARAIRQELDLAMKTTKPALAFDPKTVSGKSGGSSPRPVAGTTTSAPVAATYQITVNAPVGSSPADIGRQLTSYIDAYESRGGRRKNNKK